MMDTQKLKLLESKYAAALIISGFNSLVVLTFSFLAMLTVALAWLFVSGAFLILCGCRLTSARKLDAGTVATGMGLVLKDFFSAVEQTTRPPDVVTIARSIGLSADYEIGDKNTDWVSRRFLASNVALVGNAGSGKSVQLIHYTDLVIKEWGLDSIFAILSTHYSPNPKNPLMQWAKGIPVEVMAEKVSRDKAENIKQLRRFEKLLEARRRKADEDAPLSFIVIDDFQHQFHSGDKEEAANIIETVIDEGRKYNVRILIALHSIKTKQTKTDSTVIWSMTCVLFDTALLDANSERLFPRSLAKDKQAVLKDLEYEASRLGEHGSKLVALIWAGTLFRDWRGGRISRLPNRVHDQIEFKMDDQIWLDQAKATILNAIHDESISGITAALKLVGITNFHKKDGIYVKPEARMIQEWWTKEIEVEAKS